MKNFKKIALSFCFLIAAAFLPITLAACGGPSATGKNIEKAIGSAIEVIKANSTSAEELNLETVEGDVSGSLFLIDYLKAIAGSSKYDAPALPFKSKASVKNAMGQMDVFGVNRLSLDGNNVSVEMVFTYEASFANADYEWMTINYDFETDTLISFKWYSYFAADEGTLYYCEYANEELKYLPETDTENYATYKASTREKAEALYNETELASKTYDFSKEYVAVYNSYNPENPIQQK